MKTADILIFQGVENLYTYTISNAQTTDCTPGCIVEVQFGKKKAHGLIVTIHAEPIQEKKFPLKPIIGIAPNQPQISQDNLNLILWLKRFYQLTPYKAFQTVIGQKKLRHTTQEENAIQLSSDHILNEEQKAAVKAIISDPSSREFLLFGITGSGKTEVYIHLARTFIQKNKKVLILLPEIALTPQVRTVFKSRFGQRVMVIHSGLTPKERELAWNAIYQGQSDIVIGPRSAIFCPMDNIGLIVIDEEHEPSYKQENHPRYYTHTIARYRASENQAKLVLGSATPSIENYHAATQCIKLQNRINQLPLPPVTIVDMNEEIQSGNLDPISNALHQALAQNIQKKEKSIILINRRGYAPVIVCQKCGYYYCCPSCQMSYTYHRDKSLRCHRCNRIASVTNTCPKCKKQTLAFAGIGIQKVEIQLQKLFRDAVIYRLDRDNVKTHQEMESTLNAFVKDGDILLGTQLVAKGHHFEAVTLVGVLGIDTVLNIPDFRSTERTFQLITQVAGRAGRGDKLGKVFVQTLQPNHYAIKAAAGHDYESFYQAELRFREELWYPPFSSLINIIFSSQNKEKLMKYAQTFAQWLQTQLKTRPIRHQLIGPKPAPVEMLKNYYRWHLLIKCENSESEWVKTQLSTLPDKPYNIRLIIDFDPRSIL